LSLLVKKQNSSSNKDKIIGIGVGITIGLGIAGLFYHFLAKKEKLKGNHH
jgi:hypothetical protein